MDRNHGSTDLVHLTVGSIANYLHQLKDTSWVLEKKDNMVKEKKRKDDKGQERCWATSRTAEPNKVNRAGQSRWTVQ